MIFRSKKSFSCFPQNKLSDINKTYIDSSNPGAEVWATNVSQELLKNAF